MKNNDVPRILWFSYFGLLIAVESWFENYLHTGGILYTVTQILRLHFGIHLVLSQWYLVAQYKAIKRGETPRRFSWQPLDTWYSVAFVPRSDRACKWYLFCTATCLVGIVVLFVTYFLK